MSNYYTKKSLALLLLLLGYATMASAQTRIINTIAGYHAYLYTGYAGDGGPASAAQFAYTDGLACDSYNNIYIADRNNNKVRKIDTNGIITTFAGIGPVYPTGTGSGFGGDGGAATAAHLWFVTGVATDGRGNVLICDQGNYRIRKVDATGTITTVAGNGGTSTSATYSTASPATATGIAPVAVGADRQGNIYICDQNSWVFKVDTTGMLRVFAGTGSPFGGFSTGPATAANLNNPNSVACDRKGNVYIAVESEIFKVDTTGTITTFAGGGSAPMADGVAATATSVGPTNLFVADDGSVYFLDDVWTFLRKIDTAGIITTIAGSHGGYCEGCPATVSGIRSYGLTMDSRSNFYITEDFWFVRKISNNHTPKFINGHSQSATVCAYSTDSIGALLAVIDSDFSQSIVWSLASTPTHGTAMVADTLISAGDTLRPAGLYYTPTGGYTGPDSFKVQVSDGIVSDTTTIHVNVSPSVGAVAGPGNACTGIAAAFSDTTAGGTWSISPPSYGTIGAATGVFTGMFVATVTVSYSKMLSCGLSTRSAIVTVNLTPAAPSVSGPGSASVCPGSTVTLSDITPGGTWSSPAPAIATIGSGGSVTGISPGTDTIRYTLGTGCASAIVITVNSLPSVIAGPGGVCMGATSSLSDTVTGGRWGSSAPGIASVDSLTGLVTGNTVGTAIISYTLPTGCLATKSVTVNIPPSPISGVTDICPGATSTLFNSTPGGTWSSSSPAIATIDTAGNITGVATGTTNISYSMGPGCAAGMVLTVDAAPPAITGLLHVCPGLTTALSDSVTGGTWTSGAPGIVSIGYYTGVATGIGLGTATITYTAPSGCTATAIVTVNSTPTAITGPGSVCIGGNITLHDGVSGGTWTSGAPGIATIGSATGIVTGIATGSAPVTYSMGPGCSTTYTVNVTPGATAVSGVSSLCPGGSATFAYSHIVAGTTSWSASPGTLVSFGIINDSTATVTGASPGAGTITFTSNGCSLTRSLTVNPPPSVITGSLNVCPATTTSLSDFTTGGTWTSATPAIATIGSVSGLVTGVAAGHSVITYTASTGCYTTTTVTVNSLPAAVSGASGVCTGASISLTDGTPGGTWSKSNSNINIGTTGTVTGITAGTSMVSYTLPSGCYATKIITVNATPPAPVVSGGGTLQVCAGALLTLTAPGGGVWSTGTGGLLAIGSSSGIVSGVSAGVQGVTYTISGTGCSSNAVVTVNSLPALFTVTGGGSYCAGGAGVHVGLAGSEAGVSYQLYNGSSVVGTLLPGTTGILDFGLQAGPGTYTVMATNTTTGCARTMTGSALIAINPLPAVISGPTAVCVGATMTETDAGGGTWTATPTSIATVGSATGVATGIAIGTATITYTLSTGCLVIKVITVSTAPSSISGASTVCTGATATLTDAVSGGTWTTAATTASVGSASGTVTGLSAGTAVITYSLGSGCTMTKAMTINASPASITGSTGLCAGHTTILSDATSGGSWSATGTATVGSTGVVSGISAGTANITYSLPDGCNAVTTVTVNSLPPSIAGTLKVCVGATTVLSNSAGGGLWTSGTMTVATAGSSGVVTGVAPGTSVITYSLGTGCSTTATVTVDATPAAIAGATSVCTGGTATLSETTAGGTWSISGAATISSATGVVSGITAGTATASYTLPTGCAATTIITVNPLPQPITIAAGTNPVCAGLTTTLNSLTSGGTWSSSTGAVAIGSATGIVTGATPGTAVIRYILPTGCQASTTFTVNAAPLAITGTPVACVGLTTTLGDPVSGGTWSSTAPGIATVGSSGIVTGVTAGTCSISYTAGGCAATVTMTVNNLPGIAPASSAICAGSAATFSATAGGGSWASGASGIATAGSATGVVTGISAGVTTITYSLGAGCYASVPVTVNPLPATPAPLSGPGSICMGATTTLTDGTPGGAWSSGNAAIATVGSSGGVVTGISGGAAPISYVLTATGCSAVFTVNVVAVPPLTGIRNMCAWGDTLTISDADSTGSYSSTGVTVTGLGGGSGRVNAYAPGVAIISYTLPLGCSQTIVLTVNPLPGAITGASSLCAGSSEILGNSVSGGHWSSGAAATAAVDSLSGALTGISAGAARITYTLPTGCKVDTSVRVVVLPLAGRITATAADVCVGRTLILADTVAIAAGSTAIWQRSNVNATVTAGLVTAIAPGTDTISYVVSNACGITKADTVIHIYPVPSAGVITGVDTVCVGNSITLTDTTGGGVWSISNPVASLSATGVLTGLAAGRDTVLYTVSNPGCSATIAYSVTVMPTNWCVSEHMAISGKNKEALKIYPNPASDELTVAYQLDEDAVFQLLDVSGREVMNRKLDAHKQEETINMRAIADGIYLYRVVDSNGIVSAGKIVKNTR